MVTCKWKGNRLGSTVSLTAFEYCPHYSVVRLRKLNVKKLFHFHFNMVIEKSYEYVKMKTDCISIFMLSTKECGVIYWIAFSFE